MNTVQTASAPQTNATVMASAGTGKTWLLITRLIRLLLDGAEPNAILAVTFTRKAAAEMQSRLRERLYDYLIMGDKQLASSLAMIGLDADTDTLHEMRHLFEKLLRHEQTVRITTYHAFCQDVLHRFPFDAGVPPGFDLVENTGLLVREAWEALISETTTRADSTTAEALKLLLEYHGGIDGPRKALETFLNHRIDWWAYTLGQRNPVAHAMKILSDKLDVDPQSDPGAVFLGGDTFTLLDEFLHLLDKHPIKKNSEHGELLREACESTCPQDQKLQLIRTVFLTQKGEPRARKASATQSRKMGDEGQQRFLEIHNLLCERLAQLREQQNRLLTLRLNRAWYQAGTAFLGHYTRIKTERRQLDFSDLEWHTYLLLHHSDQALWVQYKLDHRINHFLVDEFQDTNPTQWAMLLPLLEELAAGNHERQRSVFLVGDGKQSIYRFRRANPHLFYTADEWMQTHLQATRCTLDTSRRSAPVIIDFVNRIFMSDVFKSRLPSFHTHGTHHEDLWGRVEIQPLVIPPGDPETEAQTEQPQELRNPLLAPRPPGMDDLHFSEGELIARRIREIVATKTRLTTHERTHQAGYSDITILVRSRTHIHHYERALRNAGIPYLGGGRTTLLDCLEIQDMVALLELLVAPYNNLSLACVLRSPLFACSDDDLIFLAQMARRSDTGTASWFDVLTNHQQELAHDSPLRRAWDLLSTWRELVGQLPVHDLLDRIYCDANVLQRYHAAFPSELRSRARGNLIRFIEMALEVDSGRYPSLSHFLNRIRALHQHDHDALEEAPHLDQQNAVRIMTIHAAKGLEAPIVFLADSARTGRRPGAYQLLVDWPGEDARPASFLISSKRAELDSWSRQLHDEAEAEDLIEETNLLYVALTRARQWLILTGCMPKSGNHLGWYGDIVTALDSEDEVAQCGFAMESGRLPTPQPPAVQKAESNPGEPDPRLSQPLDILPAPLELTPSTLPGETQDNEELIQRWQAGEELPDSPAFNRGIVIHRMLDLLTRLPGQRADQTDADRARLHLSIAHEFGLDSQEPECQACWQEALAVVGNKHLGMLFDEACFQQAINEVPLIYQQDGQIINGIIDRLVISDTLTLVDYKTHRHARPENLAQLATPYRRQMECYARGVRKLWPDRPLRVLLLFTACATPFELDPTSP